MKKTEFYLRFTFHVVFAVIYMPVISVVNVCFLRREQRLP